MKEELVKRRKNNKGFSLVELIIVIAIMAVLVGVLAPQFIKYVNNSKVSTDIKNGQEIASAISAGMADGVIKTNVDTAAECSTLDESVRKMLGGSTLPSVKFDSNYKWTYTCNVTTGEVHVYCGGLEVYPDPSADKTGYEKVNKK
ncbi:type II secretion system protein [Anaerosacchariphilus polymeriproducens]|uniref:Type II secretion system protein n=1 Tax=Anaerosacchariphilus polymeriproducens TaxID=1812858 RepID=A0A371AQY8_9FIRM|nr:type II secretion system protein [Anaerosacchariphilus polymeriproducens]RDU21850.1 type II secretion system protein [Anaerosacchariphilus polymeriproducens]